MKRLLGSLIAILTITTSQASMNQNGIRYRDSNPYVIRHPIAIQKGLVHVNSNIPRVPKPKLFRSNPLRKSLILTGSDPYDTIDDEDYISNSYRRSLEPKNVADVDDELPEHIRWRLFLARTAAMIKYHQIHA